MGEGTGRLDRTHADENGRDGLPAKPREAALALGGEIASVRSELDVLLAELDRRRHNALDLELQVRQHALGIAVTAVAFVGAASGFVWFGVWRARRRRRLIAHGDRLRIALSRMMAHPERVAHEPTMFSKIVTAAVNAALASLIKKTLDRAVAQALPQRPPLPTRPTRAIPASRADGDRVAPDAPPRPMAVGQ